MKSLHISWSAELQSDFENSKREASAARAAVNELNGLIQIIIWLRERSVWRLVRFDRVCVFFSIIIIPNTFKRLPRCL